jgi:thioredoxin-like negative regulator of GroEL
MMIDGARTKPMMDDERLAEIDRALAEGKVTEAVALSEAALSTGVADPFLFHLVAWQRARVRDFDAAHLVLQRGLALAPDDPNLQIGVATILRLEGRIDEALKILDAMLIVWPDSVQIHLESGFAHEFGGALEAAASSYGQAAALDPASAPALAGIGTTLARLGRIAEARSYAEQALTLDPANATAQIAIARCALEERAPADAVHALGLLLKRKETGVEDRILAHGLKGEALEQLGHYGDAFEAYAAGKALFAQAHGGARAKGAPTLRAFVEGVLAAVEAEPPSAVLPSAIPAPIQGHAFLLGFPRSGTTLVENILAAALGVVAIEERPTLRSADLAFLSDAEAMAALDNASAETLDVHRKAYWESAAGFAGGLSGTMLLDMDPLKGIKLPIIARLFPEARIIFMQRDPREVVWSCFKTSFAPTAAALDFTTLEDAARLYDAVMRLTMASLARFPLAVHPMRYDRLVSDFDAETQALCAFLDLKWSPDLREFASVAQRRGVATASVSQVRKGLYNGTGQWRHHADKLASVMPILAPWMERFGFSDAGFTKPTQNCQHVRDGI